MYTKDIDIFAKLMTSIETYILFQKHEQEWFCASYVNVTETKYYTHKERVYNQL